MLALQVQEHNGEWATLNCSWSEAELSQMRDHWRSYWRFGNAPIWITGARQERHAPVAAAAPTTPVEVEAF
jgi:hypothetical protein